MPEVPDVPGVRGVTGVRGGPSRPALRQVDAPYCDFVLLEMTWRYACAYDADGIISMRSDSGGINRSGSLFRIVHGLVYTFGSVMTSQREPAFRSFSPICLALAAST